VRAEAEEALHRNILVPVSIEDLKIPLLFRPIQSVRLIHWQEDSNHPQFVKLISALSSILGLSPLKVKEAEQLRAEEEKRRKEQEEQGRRAAEEKRRKEQELKRKAEEERLKKEAEAKRKADEKKQRKEVKAEIKPDKPEPDKIKPPEPKPEATEATQPESPESQKSSKFLKLGLLAGVIILLIITVWFYISHQLKEQARRTRAQIEVAKQELIYAQQREAQKKGKVFVESNPGNATVKILNIDEPFQQGMELEPGHYQMRVSAQGYEAQTMTFSLEPGKEERIRIELAKIKTTEPPSPQKVITNSVGMNFVLIPSGSFMMGNHLSPKQINQKYALTAHADEYPLHEVSISKPFYIQTTEVTQGQWKKIMGNNPSKFKDCGDNCPVEQVSWNDTQGFIKRLNDIEGTDKYRLPTEAEWEYACRAGTVTPFSFGEDIYRIDEYAWTYSGDKSTHAVGQKKPNPWGIYDMYGNVREWCQDWEADYPGHHVIDPKGPPFGQVKVNRGGQFNSSWEHMSSTRSWGYIDEKEAVFGFRVVRDF